MRLRVLLFGIGLCALLAANICAAETFRWRAANGVVHYSNLLPPDVIDRGYEVIGANGEIIKRVPPPLTPAQRTQAEAEARRLEHQAALRQAQAEHDQMLLSTFDSVAGIERLRDDRIGALDGQLRLAKDSLMRLQKQQEDLDKRTAEFTKQGRHPSRELVQEAAQLQSDVTDMQRSVRALQDERSDTRRRFDADIARFKQLQAEGRVPR